MLVFEPFLSCEIPFKESGTSLLDHRLLLFPGAVAHGEEARRCQSPKWLVKSTFCEEQTLTTSSKPLVLSQPSPAVPKEQTKAAHHLSPWMNWSFQLLTQSTVNKELQKKHCLQMCFSHRLDCRKPGVVAVNPLLCNLDLSSSYQQSTRTWCFRDGVWRECLAEAAAEQR